MSLKEEIKVFTKDLIYRILFLLLLIGIILVFALTANAGRGRNRGVIYIPGPCQGEFSIVFKFENLEASIYKGQCTDLPTCISHPMGPFIAENIYFVNEQEADVQALAVEPDTLNCPTVHDLTIVD